MPVSYPVPIPQAHSLIVASILDYNFVAVPARGFILPFLKKTYEVLFSVFSLGSRELFLENDVAHEGEEVENIMIWPDIFLVILYYNWGCCKGLLGL